MTETSFVAGWMIWLPLLILAGLVVWSMLQPDHEWDVQRCSCEDNEDECLMHGLDREGY